MRRQGFVAVATVAAFWIAPAAYAHPFNPPNGGNGDTPTFNADASIENGSEHYFAAIENSGGAAANALFRNPSCDGHGTGDGIHPPGNP
jgi:hypothetical protein